jgi:hypothetical protein
VLSAVLIFQEMLRFHPEADPNLQRDKNKQLHLAAKGYLCSTYTRPCRAMSMSS